MIRPSKFHRFAGTHQLIKSYTDTNLHICMNMRTYVGMYLYMHAHTHTCVYV